MTSPGMQNEERFEPTHLQNIFKEFLIPEPYEFETHRLLDGTGNPTQHLTNEFIHMSRQPLILLSEWHNSKTELGLSVLETCQKEECVGVRIDARDFVFNNSTERSDQYPCLTHSEFNDFLEKLEKTIGEFPKDGENVVVFIDNIPTSLNIEQHASTHPAQRLQALAKKGVHIILGVDLASNTDNFDQTFSNPWLKYSSPESTDFPTAAIAKIIKKPGNEAGFVTSEIIANSKY